MAEMKNLYDKLNEEDKANYNEYADDTRIYDQPFPI